VIESWRELDRLSPARARVRGAARRVALDVLRRRPRPDEPGVRVVHYHYVFPDQRDNFARQLALLSSAFEPVSLSDAVGRIEAGTWSGRELAVTFDDGFRNQLEHGAPLLREHGFSGCFYLITDFVGAGDEATERFCRERILMRGGVTPMDWDDARELLAQGHEVGSHTVSHPNLAAADDETIDHELRESRATLHERLGIDVAHFCPPFGDAARFDSRVTATAQSAGYRSCATSIRGANADPTDVWALRRHHVEADWPLDDVRWFLGVR
jgi:peptidoglycan/xylan/chitin deacetylase (PgdA/CDA1 family)